MKFIVDGMLGKLMRWLRLSGHDTLYVDDLDARGDEDRSLLEVARSQGRILLTSDSELYRRAKKRNVKCALLKGENVVEQLLDISKFLGKKIEIDFENSRCPACNGELMEVGQSEVEGLVPEKVMRVHQKFWVCERCRKVYWEGSHWKNIRETAEKYERMVENAIA